MHGLNICQNLINGRNLISFVPLEDVVNDRFNKNDG